MRLNQYLARASGVSRRQADKLIAAGNVKVNNKPAELGQKVGPSDTVTLSDRPVALTSKRYVVLNKPPGYVVSRKAQADEATIYELLPEEFWPLKPVGRLDKDSRGLLLLTDDGPLAQRLTHPSYQKEKVYRVKLHKPLEPAALAKLKSGIKLKDGLSQLTISIPKNTANNSYRVVMKEGRSRQIRRTFAALDYEVIDLKRTNFGPLKLKGLAEGEWQELTAATFAT